MSRSVHVELLVGRRVRDANDRVVGRIQAIHVRRRGHHYFVDEYHIGPAALLKTLGISAVKLVGLPSWREPLRIPWQKLDLSDPEHPRLNCAREELERT